MNMSKNMDLRTVVLMQVGSFYAIYSVQSINVGADHK